MKTTERTVHYELNCLQYVLHIDGKPARKPLDEVAIAYAVDKEDGLITRHKHGDPDDVRAWLEKTKAGLAQQGEFGQKMANELQIYVGKPDVNLLNDAINGVERALRNIVMPPLVIDVEARVLSDEHAQSAGPSKSAHDNQDDAPSAPRAGGFRRFARP